MLVTFKANSRVLNYMPGRIYTVELDPLLKSLLEQDVHLNLIDPPTLDENYGIRNKNANHAAESGQADGQSSGNGATAKG